MSEQITFPVQTATQIVIEELARDVQVWGTAETSRIEVVYQPHDTRRAPVVAVEGNTLRMTAATAQRITLPATLALTIKRAAGDLHVHGLVGAVNIETAHGDLRLSDLGGACQVARVDGTLRAEGIADLLLGNCAGDLRFENSGNLEAESVAGDVRISRAAAVRLGRVHGDLWAELLRGELQCERVSGDTRLNEISGPVNLRVLYGDLRGLNLTGGLAAPQVQGDAVLQGAFAGGAAFTVNADGDITLLLTGEADARLVVHANGRIRSDVQLTPAADGAPTFSATLGQGSSRINLTSSGDIRIAQAGAGTARVAAEIHAGPPAKDLRTLGERIRQQVITSLAAAGIPIEGGRGARPGRPPRAAPPPPVPPAPPRPAAALKTISEEELRILKMVENGTITAAQAELLLKAIEG